MEIETIIFGFVIFFIVIITSATGFTVMHTVMPVMSDVANQSSFINATEYNQKQDFIWNAVKIALFICIGIPLVYIAIRLLYRREPTSYVEGY